MSSSYIEYEEVTYNTFTEFSQEHPEASDELVAKFDPDPQQAITYYPTAEDYALAELEDGWYVDVNLGNQDYHGAPNPLDWMDLDAFGKRLVATGDGNTTQQVKSGAIVTADAFW